jgi:hypothetical protein
LVQLGGDAGGRDRPDGSPKVGEVRDLPEIADELARLGHLGPGGKPYFPGSVRAMPAR